MVLYVIELLVRSKIPDEQTHGEFASANLGVSPPPALLVPEKFSIGDAGIDIRNHHVCREYLSRLRLNTCYLSAILKDARDRLIIFYLTAISGDKIGMCVDDGSGPADRIVHPEFALQMRDQAVIGRCREWVPAN